MHFSTIDDLHIIGSSPAIGRQTNAGAKTRYFPAKCVNITRQMALTAAAICITSNKSLTCLQLVVTSNWSNFRHAFASREFVSVSWAFSL